MKRYAIGSWCLVGSIVLMVATAAVLDHQAIGKPGKPVPMQITYDTLGPCPGGVCPVPSQGQGYQRVTPHAAVVRVEGQEPGGGSFGTGTIIAADGNFATVLTAWHILRGGGTPYVHVRGERIPAAVILSDKKWDVAVWQIRDPGVEPLPLADQMPPLRERLLLCGYGSGQYAAQPGAVTGDVSPGQGEPNDLLECSGQARKGDSGGPICDSRGHVVGVISAAGDNFTIGCGVRRIRVLIEACHRRRGPRPGQYNPGTPCQPLNPCDPVGPAPSPDPGESLPTPALPPIPAIPPPPAPAPAPAPNGMDANTPAGMPAVPAALARDVADLKRSVADLRVALSSAAGRPGPQGPAGPISTGSITIQTIDVDGAVLQSAEAHLGETIQFQLVPVSRK